MWTAAAFRRIPPAQSAVTFSHATMLFAAALRRIPPARIIRTNTTTVRFFSTTTPTPPPPPPVDESSWIWHTDRKTLKAMKAEEFLEFCRQNGLSDDPQDEKTIQMSQRMEEYQKGDNQGRKILTNMILQKRNQLRKQWPQYNKDFRERQLLDTPEQKEIFDKYPDGALRQLCRRYTIDPKGKKRPTLVREFLKRKKMVPEEVEVIMEKYKLKQLKNFAVLVDIDYRDDLLSGTKLYLAYMLHRMRNMTLLVLDGLVRYSEQNGVELPKKLHMRNLDKEPWQKQLFFYVDPVKRQMIFDLLGIKKGKEECFAAMVMIAKHMKIKLPEPILLLPEVVPDEE